MRKLCLAVAMFAMGVVHAATRSWTGLAGDNEWTNTLNWTEQSVPRVGDRAVFDPQSEDVLDVKIRGSNFQLGDIEVRSGNVLIQGSSIHFYGSAREHEILVAADATLSISNAVLCWTADKAHSIHKRGPGTYKMMYNFGANCKKLHIEEGVFHHPISASGGIFQCDVDIYAGAELKLRGYNAFHSSTRVIVNVHKDALFSVDAGWGQNYFAAIVGQGEVRADGTSLFYMNLPADRGPYVFGGRFSVASKTEVIFESRKNEPPNTYGKWIVASADALATVKKVEGIGALGFAPGLEEIPLISNAAGGGTLDLVDTNGAPAHARITLFGSSSTSINTTGSGDLIFVKKTSESGTSVTLTNSCFASTGRIVSDISTEVCFGNGQEECDCDFSSVGELAGAGAFIFNNFNFTDVTMPVVGSGHLEVYGAGAAFSALNSRDGTLQFNTNVTVEATVDKRSYQGFIFSSGNPHLCVKSGLHYTSLDNIANDKVSILKKPTPVFPQNLAGMDAQLTIDGGEFYAGVANWFDGYGKLLLRGGKYVSSGTYGPSEDATEENPSRIVFDGGHMAFNIGGLYNLSPFRSTNTLEVSVGEKGGTISMFAPFYGDYSRLTISKPFVSAVGPGGRDGGIVRIGRGMMTFNRPFALEGPVAFRDGINNAGVFSGIAQTPEFFGKGDFELENAVVDISDIPAPSTVRLAAGEGAHIVYGGASVFRLGGATNFHHVVAGNAASQENSVFVRKSKGSVLFLDEIAGDARFDGSASTVKAYGGVALNAGGVVSQPIVAVCPIGSNTCYPFTYDEDRGFLRFDDYVDSPSEQEGSSFLCVKSATALASGSQFYHIGVNINNQDFRINSGSTLHLGNGVDPSLVIVGSGNLNGDGAIDFGRSEGVFIISDKGSANRTDVSCVIAGQNGVTFASSPRSLDAVVNLFKANAFAGGAYIAGTGVRVRNSGALGLGDVHVMGAERSGGYVILCEGMDVANDLYLQGWGNGRGALCFEATSRVSGNVDIAPNTRITVQEGACGDIAGCVSGDRLTVYNSKGVLTISGECSHTGGTEVVASTVVRTGEEVSLGTGDVVLDGGTLIFDASAACEFPSRISGIGTVGLKGSAPVAFTGDLSELDATLDLLGTRQRFVSMPQFASITNSASVKATLEIGANLGTLQWGDVEIGGKTVVEIGSGTTIDLGGKEITILRKEGDGKFSNGTVNETRPLRGMAIIVR